MYLCGYVGVKFLVKNKNPKQKKKHKKTNKQKKNAHKKQNKNTTTKNLAAKNYRIFKVDLPPSNSENSFPSRGQSWSFSAILHDRNLENHYNFGIIL